MSEKKKFKTIDEYLSMFPKETREILENLRKHISKLVPNAKETINYNIPTFKLHGNLVHFAAFEKHIGFYPTPSGIDAFKEELAPYKPAKGSVKFPINKPIPYDLVEKIVEFRVKEQLNKKN
jgi:uncharacterized protein YdhG (YjbR/CyaY superfamily)